jgi:peptide/nickel transport system permease protein
MTPAAGEASRSLWADAWRRLRGNVLAMACLCVIVMFAFLSLLAFAGMAVGPGPAGPEDAPRERAAADVLLFADYDVPDKCARRKGPSVHHPFGTNVHGKDVLSRVVHGARIAMTLGVLAALAALAIGAVLGALAGWRGGWVDEFVVWLYSTVATIPGIMMMIAVAAVVGKGFAGVLVAMGVTYWVGICRLVRAEFLRLRERDYVLAARALGLSGTRIALAHVAPNAVHLLIIGFSLLFVEAIKAEVVLSFLGVGLINEPSWGILIADSETELMRGEWWQLTFTSLAMFVLILAFQVFGDALRDALDPRLRH